MNMGFSEFENKRYEQTMDTFIEKRRPPPEVRDQVDISYRIENQSITIFEIRPTFMNPKEKMEEAIAKTTYVKSSDNWKIFWMKRDLKWHGYEPDPVVESLEEFLSIVGEDAYCCFWG